LRRLLESQRPGKRPLRVIGRHQRTDQACPLFGQERTCLASTSMSAAGLRKITQNLTVVRFPDPLPLLFLAD
jgi:hypothetical protein